MCQDCGCGSIKLSAGATGPIGATGATGATGANGVGISSATVDGNGDLIIVYTDGTQTNAGAVVGPQGEDGSTKKYIKLFDGVLAFNKDGSMTGIVLTITQPEVASSNIVLSDLNYVVTIWLKQAGSQNWSIITPESDYISNFVYNSTSDIIGFAPRVNGAFKVILIA